MIEAVAAFLEKNAIFTLFSVIGVGYLLGQARFFGFRLGVAGVLFVGLAVGALGPGVALPPMVSTFGLILFIYSLGIQYGPTFVNPFRKAGRRDSLFCVAMLVLAAAVTLGVAVSWSLDAPTYAGLFCGALTNAPALAGVQEALGDKFTSLPADALGQLIDKPVIGFGIAYPFGVLGVMLSFQLYRTVFRIGAAPRKVSESIEVRDFTIVNPELTKGTLSEVLAENAGSGFVVSRMRRGQQSMLAVPDSHLALGDIVAVVGTAASLECARQVFGESSPAQIEHDRDVLDYRRVFVSSPATVGKSIGELDLQHKLSATITRVRRGDVDIVPTPQTRLAYGDRVRVLSAPSNLAAVSRFFGDSIRGTAEIDFASVGLGMALGVVLGSIPFPLPGGSMLRLGFAGGPLVIGLILGRLERTGPLTWSIPTSASLTLRQIGLVLFQAGVGTRAGYGFLQTVRSSGVSMILAGAFITSCVALVSLFVGHRLMKQPFERVLGLTAAIHTEPASLAFAGLVSDSDAPQEAYSRVFPLCTVAKIVLAQILVR